MGNKNTLVISAFPACGKTYLANDGFLECIDLDSSKFNDGTKEWVFKYVSAIKDLMGKVNFILVSQHGELLKELDNQGIPFVVVAPNNADWLTDKERNLIKQQWFGRFILRDNSHIKDFNTWLNTMKENYDKWTNLENLMKHHPLEVFTLQSNEYLSDIIEEVFWFNKERVDEN